MREFKIKTVVACLLLANLLQSLQSPLPTYLHTPSHLARTTGEGGGGRVRGKEEGESPLVGAPHPAKASHAPGVDRARRTQARTH